MNRVCISYSSKNRLELTRQTLPPLLPQKGWDLWWYDASTEDEAMTFFYENDPGQRRRLTGGSCRYIVCALTEMLAHGKDNGTHYDYVGLSENDVLLDEDWFEPTMDLFWRGSHDGLKVGAASARTYEDRILIQRDGYGVMHNLGAGHIVFSREAAELVLNQYRTGMTGENRRVFSMLSGIDIGRYWAFKGIDQMLVADWSWDRMMAQQGFASLALTPCKANQLEDIEKQGLKAAKEPVDALRNDHAFDTFRIRTSAIRDGHWNLPSTPGARLYHDTVWTVFPHQIFTLGGSYSGDWRFKWSLGWGCFAWKSGAVPEGKRPKTNGHGWPVAYIPCLGPVDIVCSGGEKGGKVMVEDELSGFSTDPELAPEAVVGPMQLAIPGALGYRMVKFTALTPGVIFYGLRCREAQPYYPVLFDFHCLPPL